MTTIRLAAVIGACLCISRVAAAADDLTTPIVIDMPAMPLNAALKQLARTAGFQVVFYSTQSEGLTARRLSGELTADGALKQLLQGTGLTYQLINENTVAIIANGAAEASTAPVGKPGSGKLNAANMLRLAQASAGPSVPTSLPAARALEPAELEEIVVTAQKREERLIDVPISIVAMNADELQRRRIVGLDDLALAVPGLAIQSSGSFQRRIMLRGVSNTFGNGSLIGLYLDEAAVTSASPVIQLDLPSHDLQRIEVLRGPQGTLYGEGSAGGTIRFITNAPELDEFGARLNTTALATDGEPGGRVGGVLNVPLIGDQLGVRISGVFDAQGGWMDQPAVGRDNFNDQELANVRVRTLWQPSSEFTANATVVVHRNDAAPSVGENENGDYIQTFNLATTPNVKDEYEIYNLTLSYDFPAAQLLNTSTYLNQDKRLRNQGFRFPLLGTGFDAHFLDDHRWSDVFTEELRLMSSGAGPWKWTVGAFYQDAKYDRDLSQYFAAPIAPGAPLPALSFIPTRLSYDSWAVFADSSYRLTNRLTLGAGLRYYETDQSFTSGSSVFPATTFDSLNPRVYAQFALADDVNLYASAAKGFRTGGFNNLATQPAYEPEEVWTYELGAKASFAGGRLSAEIALFHTDYSEYQIAGFVPSNPAAGNVTSNAGDAAIDGVELSLIWRPFDRWTLSANGNYIESEFEAIRATSSSHLVGDPLDLFPKYGFTVSAQRDFELGSAPAFARVDYNEQGEMTYRNRRNGPLYFNESDVINMLNAHLSIQWSESLAFGIFGQNLLNDRGYTDPFAIEENAARARPRTFGVELDITF